MDTPVPVTGATGYIGGRLLRRFEEGGRALGCLVRQPGRLHATAPTVVVDARATDPPSAPAVFAYRSIVPGRAADVYNLAKINAVRGPAYFRIDARIDRNATIAGRPVIVFLGVQNVTGRRNVGGYTWNRRTNAADASEQLGVFPLLGLEWRF